MIESYTAALNYIELTLITTNNFFGNLNKN